MMLAIVFDVSSREMLLVRDDTLRYFMRNDFEDGVLGFERVSRRTERALRLFLF